MDSISTARDFFINQQGLSPDQADMIVSKGMEAYNQQSQPQQNMMQMASGGIARLGYQMGGSSMGVGTMPMDYGQSLQVPQQMPTNFSSAQSITSNPLLNYGQPQLGTAGGTPLLMNRGGIARLGYQMGGEAMMQPQMGGEMGMPQMNEQQALETIIQLLIEQGVDPETALKLAAQILQIFAQGGEPAVEAFANQLEQQEQAEAMASGGIAGYGYRQGYGFGGIGKIFKGAAKAVSGVVKGVAKAVKSVAKSPIGRMALTIGANMLLPGAGSAFAAAFQSAAINMGLQIAGGGKFNPLESLTAGIGGYAQAGGFGDLNNIFGGTPTTTNATNITSDFSKVGLQNPDSMLNLNVPAGDAVIGADVARAGTYASKGIEGTTGNLTDYRALTQDMSGTVKPGIFQNLQTKMSDALSNPIQTLKNVGTGAIDLIEQNPKTAVAVGTGIGVGTGIALGAPQQENESDEDFAKRQQEEVNPLITYYGRNLQIKNPYFYQKFGATNPFETAAQGGIMGYKGGGSMVPPARQIEGGIIELDARKTGGYIPYGKKERVDDVPAMLAKDEFVFTSRAVKAAGGGSAKRGAAKMYALMKKLEGARA
jgi:hypothetical protein